MRAKRLAQITMVTKGIKKGKLPPIKTPKQLDVFVFGEKRKSALAMKQDFDKTHEIGDTGTGTGSLTLGTKGQFRLSKIDDTQSSKQERDTAGEKMISDPQILVSAEKVAELKKKRVTQF